MTLPHPSPRVVEAVRTLPSRQGDVVQLLYRGFTDTQIAASLGVQRSAVYMAKTRAMVKIRRAVGMVESA